MEFGFSLVEINILYNCTYVETNFIFRILRKHSLKINMLHIFNFKPKELFFINN
jgi:hypothetical protein